jgi:hypothetical protein
MHGHLLSTMAKMILAQPGTTYENAGKEREST